MEVTFTPRQPDPHLGALPSVPDIMRKWHDLLQGKPADQSYRMNYMHNVVVVRVPRAKPMLKKCRGLSGKKICRMRAYKTLYKDCYPVSLGAFDLGTGTDGTVVMSYDGRA